MGNNFSFDRVFERIYVINLAERTDRRQEVEDQLRLVGLSLESPLVNLFPAVRPTEKGEWESVGARGCFLSHLAILRECQADGVKSLLILEDDANWSRAFLSNPGHFLEPLTNRSWDFFDCGGPIYIRSSEPPVVEQVAFNQGITTTHCIGFRGNVIGDAAEYLHQISLRKYGDENGGPMHVDGAYTWFRKDNPSVRTIRFSPTMAYQRASASNIGERRLLDRLSITAPLFSTLRKIKNSIRS